MVIRPIKWRNIDYKSIFYNEKIINHKILVLGDLSTLTLVMIFQIWQNKLFTHLYKQCFFLFYVKLATE